MFNDSWYNINYETHNHPKQDETSNYYQNSGTTTNSKQKLARTTRNQPKALKIPIISQHHPQLPKTDHPHNHPKHIPETCRSFGDTFTFKTSSKSKSSKYFLSK